MSQLDSFDLMSKIANLSQQFRDLIDGAPDMPMLCLIGLELSEINGYGNKRSQELSGKDLMDVLTSMNRVAALDDVVSRKFNTISLDARDMLINNLMNVQYTSTGNKQTLYIPALVELGTPEVNVSLYVIDKQRMLLEPVPNITSKQFDDLYELLDCVHKSYSNAPEISRDTLALFFAITE